MSTLRARLALSLTHMHMSCAHAPPLPQPRTHPPAPGTMHARTTLLLHRRLRRLCESQGKGQVLRERELESLGQIGAKLFRKLRPLKRLADDTHEVASAKVPTHTPPHSANTPHTRTQTNTYTRSRHSSARSTGCLLIVDTLAIIHASGRWTASIGRATHHTHCTLHTHTTTRPLAIRAALSVPRKSASPFAQGRSKAARRSRTNQASTVVTWL